MGELIFIGLGLHDELGLSLRGLQKAREAEVVFAEFYTSVVPGLSLENLQKLLGKPVYVLNRKDLEEKAEETVIQEARNRRVALLVPGDPLIATTHISIRIQAKRLGIETSVVHGSSIATAAIGLSGLQNYRFGKPVSIPFPEPGFMSETPYDVIAENKRRHLHSLVFLDVKAEEKRYMTIGEALNILLSIEEKRKEGVVTVDSLVVGIARAGSDNPVVKTGLVMEIIDYDFGEAPHVLIFPDKLHFMEAEALSTLSGVPNIVLDRFLER